MQVSGHPRNSTLGAPLSRHQPGSGAWLPPERVSIYPTKNADRTYPCATLSRGRYATGRTTTGTNNTCCACICPCRLHIHHSNSSALAGYFYWGEGGPPYPPGPARNTLGDPCLGCLREFPEKNRHFTPKPIPRACGTRPNLRGWGGPPRTPQGLPSSRVACSGKHMEVCNC